MRSLPAVILAGLAALALALQLALPAYVAGRVEDRLERGGGTADVSVGAFPAVSLLAGSGGSLEASGSGLRFDLGERRVDPFDRLDDFERVEVSLRDVEAGALRISRFDLDRDGRGRDYELCLSATATPRELGEQLGRVAAGPLGGLVGALAGRVVPGGGLVALPLELRAAVASRDGRAEVSAARGSVAGLPAGPLATLVLSTVLKRL